MKTLRINDIEYQLPSAWDELSLSQLKFLARLIVAERHSEADIKLRMLLYCMGASVRRQVTSDMYIIKSRQARHALTSPELVAVASIFDFLFQPHNDVPTLAPRLIVNPLPRVKVWGSVLHGPGDALDSITYDQFVWILTWISQLQADDDAINQLIAVLYRSSSGKVCVNSVRRLPRHIKAIILWFVQGSYMFLEQRFPNVFSGGGDGSGASNVFDSQQRIIDSLADGDVTKKNQVRQSLLYDALYSMEMAAIRQKEMEKQMKSKS